MQIEIWFVRMRIPCGRHRFDSILIECAFDPDMCARVDTPSITYILYIMYYACAFIVHAIVIQ